MIKKLQKNDQYSQYTVFTHSERLKSPSVSVIMSVYNGETYLKESIDSIIVQTFKDFEFIIINDGSTDKSEEIILDYLKKEKRIILIQQQNIGLTKSLNRGLSIAQGLFIARQDADDISLKTRLAKEVDFLNKNPEYALVGTDYNEITLSGTIREKSSKYFVYKDEEIKKNFIRYNPICHTSVLFRKSILKDIGMYNDKLIYSQDYEFWFRIMNKYKVANLSEVLVYRRYTKEMLSRRHDKKQLLYILKIQLMMFIKNRRYTDIKDISFITKNIIKFLIPGFLLSWIRSN